ncbi:ParA family protein [Kineococcus sp. SYSU DK005]|uniref:ParA family protein n=1 Tax=Kineococcus sp. SYSU DK005 TaxID=3383126 RepID=UPI003D7EE865
MRTALNAIDWEALDRVVAVINGKGGVLKTALTAHLAGLTAQAPDYRVLAVDLDVQGNLALDFGVQASSDQGQGLMQSVFLGKPLEPMRQVRPDLDLVTGGRELGTLSAFIAQQAMSQRDPDLPLRALATSLAPIAGDYDFIFIDCPPGEEVLQQMALGAARWVLIPTRTDKASREGMIKVAERFIHARAGKAPQPLDLLAVVLAGVNPSATTLRANALAAMQEDLQEFGVDDTETLLTTTVVRYAETVAVGARDRGLLVPELVNVAAEAEPWWQALRDGRPRSEVGRYQSASGESLADDYFSLAAEVLGRIGEEEAARREALEAHEGIDAGSDEGSASAQERQAVLRAEEQGARA